MAETIHELDRLTRDLQLERDNLQALEYDTMFGATPANTAKIELARQVISGLEAKIAAIAPTQPDSASGNAGTNGAPESDEPEPYVSTYADFFGEPDEPTFAAPVIGWNGEPEIEDAPTSHFHVGDKVQYYLQILTVTEVIMPGYSHDVEYACANAKGDEVGRFFTDADLTPFELYDGVNDIGTLRRIARANGLAMRLAQEDADDKRAAYVTLKAEYVAYKVNATTTLMELSEQVDALQARIVEGGTLAQENAALRALLGRISDYATRGLWQMLCGAIEDYETK